MFKFTDSERAYYNEMHAIAEDAEGREVLLGLTHEETAFIMTYHREHFLERENEQDYPRVQELSEKHLKICRDLIGQKYRTLVGKSKSN